MLRKHADKVLFFGSVVQHLWLDVLENLCLFHLHTYHLMI